MSALRALVAITSLLEELSEIAVGTFNSG